MTAPTEESETSRTPPVSEQDETPATLAGSRVVSGLHAASTRGESWVRNSALYQWLTAEPDPEVIVIDLRETWTVGPFLRVLDWVIDRLIVTADDSRAVGVAQRGVTATRAAPLRAIGFATAVLGLAVAGTGLLGGVSTTRLAVGVGLAVGGLIAMQDERDWATLRETRPVALMIAALEPPDPPETTVGDEPAEQPQDRDQASKETLRTDDPNESESLSTNSSDDTEQTDSHKK